MTVKCCAIIPSYNHTQSIGKISERLLELGLAVFIIDDGSDEPARSIIAAHHSPDKQVIVDRLSVNSGKGAAVIRGFDLARAAGFTHALQVDADGQHDLSEVERFIIAAREQPEAFVAGQPIFDTTLPRSRRISRSITHFWVGVETMTADPVDSMCGLRLYPLHRVTRIQEANRLGRRMNFDVEIFVRLIWDGGPVVLIPVRVIYPPDNFSNFNLFRDTLAISATHTRLVLTMLPAATALWRRRLRSARSSSHWSIMAERGALWGLKFLALCYRLAGRTGCMIAVIPVTLYFNLTNSSVRRSSREFLSRAFHAKGIDYQPGWFATFKHALAFARKTVDTFAAWLGGVSAQNVVAEDRSGLTALAQSGEGILLIVSHVGNIDISRALLDDALRARIKVLVHTANAEKFARVLRTFRPDAMSETIQVSDVDPGTMFVLRDAIECGDWIATAADRTPVRGDQRVSVVPFLGKPAPFPQGPYILAHLLECPVYLMFCIEEDGRYRLYFEKFADRIDLPRRSREQALSQWAERFARRLEVYCLIDPFQWYNFFDFWQVPTSNSVSDDLH
ncbi:MAG TPA: glycosyltransferase [Candidatus Binataceae bacterium]|nr:glycosyltransferase [Candidatus Binataceae bacterium]